jgi:hypothetical protein
MLENKGCEGNLDPCRNPLPTIIPYVLCDWMDYHSFIHSFPYVSTIVLEATATDGYVQLPYGKEMTG